MVTAPLGAHALDDPDLGELSPQEVIDRFERLIRRDPAGRGLLSREAEFGPLCPGHLRQAAEELAHSARHVGIVTGFFVPDADPPAAETDGPLGSTLLAAALKAAGIHVTLHTDAFCAAAVTTAAVAFGLEAETVTGHGDCSEEELQEFFQSGPGRTLTHLIAVERVGPSHTTQSAADQVRNATRPADARTFDVHAEFQDRCHNMRGEIIDDVTAPLHRLFEEFARHRSGGKTVGIGDGGNEIGMGAVAWDELARRLDGRFADRIPCRIATDWTIVAGTSNWGAYALAAATLLLRGEFEALRPWGRVHLQEVLHRLVSDGPAVDGLTRRREPTVDGLPFLTYIQPWEGIRRLLGWDE